MWPRRSGVEYIQGEPKATAAYSVAELKSQGLVGAYVDMDAEDYRKLPIIKSSKEK